MMSKEDRKRRRQIRKRMKAYREQLEKLGIMVTREKDKHHGKS